MILRKILVVEDSKLLHSVYDWLLARYRLRGVVILYALNGAEGLAILEEHPDTDLVLLDLNMPVMGGMEFLKVRRERESLWCTVVLVVTTRGGDVDASEAIEAGASGYLTKPLDPDLLHAAMRRFFEFPIAQE